MKCPSCESKDLEREAAPITRTPIVRQDRIVWLPLIPSVQYRCRDCDTEFMWIRGEGIRVIGEGMQQPSDYERTPIWS